MFREEEIDISLLIRGLEGGPHYMRSLTADALVSAAEKRDRRTAEELANALRENGFPDRARKVDSLCVKMMLSSEDRKTMRAPSAPPARESAGPQRLLLK